jgi:hypothetical protein
MAQTSFCVCYESLLEYVTRTSFKSLFSFVAPPVSRANCLNLGINIYGRFFLRRHILQILPYMDTVINLPVPDCDSR